MLKAEHCEERHEEDRENERQGQDREDERQEGTDMDKVDTHKVKEVGGSRIPVEGRNLAEAGGNNKEKVPIPAVFFQHTLVLEPFYQH